MKTLICGVTYIVDSVDTLDEEVIGTFEIGDRVALLADGSLMCNSGDPKDCLGGWLEKGEWEELVESVTLSLDVKALLRRKFKLEQQLERITQALNGSLENEQ